MKFKVNDVLMMNPEYSKELTYFNKHEIVLVTKVKNYHYRLKGSCDGDNSIVSNQTIPKELAPIHFTYLGAL